MHNLLAISPIDGRYSKQTQELQEFFSEFALIKFRVLVEIKWLLCLEQHEIIRQLTHEERIFLLSIADNFSVENALEVKKIEQTTNHDVKAVEYFIKQQISTNDSLQDILEFVHFACTSEDINNLSYALMLQNATKQVLIPRIENLINEIQQQASSYKNVAMLARTHGQAATPTTVGKEFVNVAYRLQRQLKQLKHSEFLGKINGATGNFNAHVAAYKHINWLKLSCTFVKSLGLMHNPFTTQIEPHDFIAELFDNIARFNNILIDFNRDVWMYISFGYFSQKLIAGEIGSSTMPHKINPIDFENSEGNLGLACSIFTYLSQKLPISRMQRDLTDSTTLRNVGIGFAHSLISYKSSLKGLSKLELNYQALQDDLNSNVEVLSEAIQTIMRKYAIDKPYEKLKELTRGKKITLDDVEKFVNNLEISQEDKAFLKQLTPASYTGLALYLVESYEQGC